MSEHKEHASKESLEAMKENDLHTVGKEDAVPGGAHAHSPAAHEAGAAPHTKAMGDLRDVAKKEESGLRADRGGANNRGVGAGLRGDAGTRGE